MLPYYETAFKRPVRFYGITKTEDGFQGNVWWHDSHPEHTTKVYKTKSEVKKALKKRYLCYDLRCAN